MKKNFNWKSIGIIGVILSTIACLFFFSAFFTTGTEYYEISRQGFAWLAVVGSVFCYTWAIPYGVRYVASVIKYFRYGY